ncbi:hypothetical protein FisN_25Hh121 [Fistulifera solaris]|jgi:hypothetical protein|uniref:Uncharacterized protein n=1 Tax=Fistulifera solaris TaxID=1519565 RepID=A0A1Z5JW29_FISSO|nr:hypothetical protein FisN_25Hh121 [Fistulifera solaris]|eukprot:GAX18139.1 hypothetical protein FisN_25Hh121 [Fistulifera solaris]
MQQQSLEEESELRPTEVSPVRSDPSINALIQMESALQVEMTRRSVESLSLKSVVTLLKNSVPDKRLSEQLLHRFFGIACPRLYETAKDSRGQWQVSSVKCDTSRVTVLLDLAKKLPDTADPDPVILQALSETEASWTVAMPLPSNTIRQKPHLDLLQPSQMRVEGSTVEERVRARALLKEAQNQQYRSEEKGNETKEKEKWCVRIADVLQTYACTTVRRQAKFHPTEKCCMTLMDAVARLQVQVSLSKRQIVDYLLEINATVPEWIVMDVKSNENISKTASVWLTPSLYASVRHKLTHDVAPSKPLFAQSKTPLPPTSKARREAVASDKPGPLKPPEREPVEPSVQSATKRASPEPTEPVSHKKPRTALRINSNLIWSDADYDGGEAIPLTSFDSPRGLKRMFDKMNAGRRI